MHTNSIIIHKMIKKIKNSFCQLKKSYFVFFLRDFKVKKNEIKTLYISII
jgi:hypothetical protein